MIIVTDDMFISRYKGESYHVVQIRKGEVARTFLSTLDRGDAFRKRRSMRRKGVVVVDERGVVVR